MQSVSPDRVRAALTRGVARKSELARRAGLQRNVLTGAESEKWNPTWVTLEALCTALDSIERERAQQGQVLADEFKQHAGLLPTSPASGR